MTDCLLSKPGHIRIWGPWLEVKRRAKCNVTILILSCLETQGKRAGEFLRKGAKREL